MSRRSLRLDDGLLDRSLPLSSASFSVGGGGGGGWRSSRSLRSRRSQQHSSSCSESLLLLQTPRKPSTQSLHNSSLNNTVADASLLSSLLDESSIHEATMVDTFWGLDHDADPRESTVIAEQSTIMADSTLTGSGDGCTKHPVQTLSRVYCKDCETHSERKETGNAYSSSSSKHTTSTSSLTEPRPSELRDLETSSTIYCRDRSRRTRTDVLQLWLDSSVLCVRRAAACCFSVLMHAWRVCQGSKVTGRSGRCRVMNPKESSLKELHSNGSLCDDCKEKTTDAVPSSSWSSVAVCVLGLTWSAAVFTGRTAGDAFRWIHRRWHHTTTGFHPTRVPVPLVLLVPPLLLLLFSLCWFSPAGFQSVLPAVNITGWRTAVSDAAGLSSDQSFPTSQSQSAEGAVEESKEVQLYVEPVYGRPPPMGEEVPTPPTGEEEDWVAADNTERLVRLEQSVTALWEQVEAGGRRAEQRHTEVFQLYTELQQQKASQSDGGGMEAWLSGVLDQQLDQLRTRLDEDRQRREEVREQDLLQQQSQTSRLDQLELQLQTLAAKTQEVQWRQEAVMTASASSTLPAAVSVGVDRQSHDALLAEVARLEAALANVRQDVEDLSRCQDGVRQLATLQNTISEQVSSQVREEVRALVYGNQLTLGGAAAALPESLLQWLSQQYVTGSDLQVALASLELNILQNISLQLEQRRSEEAVGEAVLHATAAAGAVVTQEDVQVIVKNALRLFSQDRIGMADYALESGGGSILSTRCSETYETKAALLSLFGLPLWYFSQSPRAVIQPDIQPGNCWAFRGSTGFLVIRLSMRILPTAFTLEHIPKALAPSRMLLSAPRDFSVYGLEDDGQETGKLLGTYTYDEDGEALQTFTVSEENDEAFQIIEVQVSSNWGHPEYTCMYRFRVHGTPGDV